MPWLRHNACSGNLPNLMMPVWPRQEEVEMENPKEAHSCTDPSLLDLFSVSFSSYHEIHVFYFLHRLLNDKTTS